MASTSITILEIKDAVKKCKHTRPTPIEAIVITLEEYVELQSGYPDGEEVEMEFVDGEYRGYKPMEEDDGE